MHRRQSERLQIDADEALLPQRLVLGGHLAEEMPGGTLLAVEKAKQDGFIGRGQVTPQAQRSQTRQWVALGDDVQRGDIEEAGSDCSLISFPGEKSRLQSATSRFAD
jgi:hypothetical protein